MVFLDGSFVPTKRGGEKVGLTKKGKGTKWMFVIDRIGPPLRFHLDSAKTAEVKLAEHTPETITVPRPYGHPKCRPNKFVADRAYDSSEFRRAVRRCGIAMCVPAKRRPAKWRAKRGRPIVARGGLSALVHIGAEFRLVGRLPALAHPLGASVRRVSQLLYRRGDDNLCEATGPSGGLRPGDWRAGI